MISAERTPRFVFIRCLGVCWLLLGVATLIFLSSHAASLGISGVLLLAYGSLELRAGYGLFWRQRTARTLALGLAITALAWSLAAALMAETTHLTEQVIAIFVVLLAGSTIFLLAGKRGTMQFRQTVDTDDPDEAR